MGWWTNLTGGIASQYNTFLAIFPSSVQQGINLLLLILVVSLYVIFVWKFHKFISKKNIFELNLNKYNTSKHPGVSKFLAFIFYIIEYVLIFPFIIFVWFAIFSIFLILMADQIATKNVIIISAIVVGAIRLLAYIPGRGKKLSREVAKLLPLNLLAIAMIKENFFNFEKILGQISQLPTFFNEITLYMLFIVILEVVLRFFNFFLKLMGMEDDDEDDED
jgi:hypothetical protein